MGSYIVSQLIKAMLKKRIHIDGARILVMGLTFKENCPDLRNTRVLDVVDELSQFGAEVDVYEPWAEAEALADLRINAVTAPTLNGYDGIVLAVAHDEFKDYSAEDIEALRKPNSVVYDLKYIWPAEACDLRL